jgi:hypothetical protein
MMAITSEAGARPAGAASRAAETSSRFSVRAPGPEDRFATAFLLAFAAAVCAYLMFYKDLFRDGDTGWHLAAGRYILQTRSIPATDPFSYTFAGHAWHAHEWLAEVVMASVFNVAGWRGLTLLFAIAGGVTVFLIGRELLRWLSVRWALCALFVVCRLLHPLALARPHMLAWSLLAAWLLILLHAREKGRAPTFAALPIMLIWANLHASYIIGLGIAGVLTLEALVDQRRDRPVIVRWAAFLALAGLAACVTPHGVQGFLYPFEVSGMRALSVILEWRATNFRDDRLFIAFAIAVWALIAVRWRYIHPLRILLLAGLTAMAVAHARHQMPFEIVAALMVGPLVAGGQGEVRRQEVARRPQLWIAAAAAALLMTARAVLPFEMKDNIAFPLSAIDHVPAPLRTQPMLNGYSFGGPLILYGIRPYIDGRADMYGDAFTLDYVAMIRGDMARFRRADRRWRFGWIILPPNVRLVSKLDREPGWRRLYADRWAVVYDRVSPVTGVTGKAAANAR